MNARSRSLLDTFSCRSHPFGVSQLEQQVDIACPLAQATSRLRDFFKAHGNADGDTLKLDLRLDVHVPGMESPIIVERPIIATVQAHHLPADMTPRFAVQWAPEKPGPYPLFSGELLVESGDDYNSFILKLTGAYTPPLGIFGKGFDAVVGNRIAQATATDLLHQLKTMIEQDYQENEARKRWPGRPAERL